MAVRWGTRSSDQKTVHTPEACYRGGERLWKLIWLDHRLKWRRREVIDGVREESMADAEKFRNRVTCSDSVLVSNRKPNHSGKIESSLMEVL